MVGVAVASLEYGGSLQHALLRDEEHSEATQVGGGLSVSPSACGVQVSMHGCEVGKPLHQGMGGGKYVLCGDAGSS